MTNENWKIVKKLQSFYAWLEFYKTNQQLENVEKTQKQIKNFKQINNLT